MSSKDDDEANDGNKDEASDHDDSSSHLFAHSSESGEDYKEGEDEDSDEGELSSGAGEGGVDSARTIPHQSQLCICQQLYLAENNSKKVLYLLSIGLKDSDGVHALFSFENEPWSKLPKTSMRPLNQEYIRLHFQCCQHTRSSNPRAD
jgi:hypothetical protein